jgi:hypothetical protein
MTVQLDEIEKEINNILIDLQSEVNN